MKKKVNNVNDALIDLRNAVHEKEIVQNENPSKAIDIVKNILDLNKQQKSNRRPDILPAPFLELPKHLKILNAKQMVLRLAIALAQVKASNASENLLNVIRQIIYFCIEWKKVLKKYITM